jgi:hypothetical protein
VAGGQHSRSVARGTRAQRGNNGRTAEAAARLALV